MDLQMAVAEEAKKMKMHTIAQVLWIFDDLVDDASVMHSNSNLIATLAIRSRHFGEICGLVRKNSALWLT